MHKRSHKLLAQTVMDSYGGFGSRRFRLAFLVGSVQPDCNPLSYLKGSLHALPLRGHNYSNSQRYIERSIRTLQSRRTWSVRQYYRLGKLSHYMADAFTCPHNENFTQSQLEHHQYETLLRLQLAQRLEHSAAIRARAREDLIPAIRTLHRHYLDAPSDRERDLRYILLSNSLLVGALAPHARAV